MMFPGVVKTGAQHAIVGLIKGGNTVTRCQVIVDIIKNGCFLRLAAEIVFAPAVLPVPGIKRAKEQVSMFCDIGFTEWTKND